MKWHEKLKFARKASRLTVRDIERLTGISSAYVSQIENGKINDPSFFKMVKILQIYNLDINDIFRGNQP